MQLLRILRNLMLVLALGVWNNHCILSDALAAGLPKSTSNSHCHNEKDDHHNEKGTNHHSKCNDSGCCQPALQSADASSFSNQVVLYYTPVLSNLFVIQIYSNLEINPLSFFEGTGPPGKQQTLISSLTSAPNAPPISSSYC